MNPRSSFTASSESDWSQIARYRVGDTVQYNNCYWQNTSGRNSTPDINNNDWQFVSEAQPYYKSLKIKKHINNHGKGLQKLDFAEGQRNEHLYWNFAQFIGNNPDIDGDWDVVTETPLN